MSTYLVDKYGAVGDGVTKDTAHIQQAIDHCYSCGGGIVQLGPGCYLCGTLQLRSGIELQLLPNAVLLCSADERDFTDGVFIYAADGADIAITGNGVIDGQGDAYLVTDDEISEAPLRAKKFRPVLCRLTGCHNVAIRGILIRNTAAWGIHLVGCKRVNINGVTILNNLRGPNTDGIDPDCCQDVHISDCHIETGDDCIVLKTTQGNAQKYGACSDITVTNCTLISRSCALKIGTETHADIRNCVFQNCTIRSTNRGIGIWSRDGGIIENMIFSQIVMETRLFAPEMPEGRNWWGKGEPVFISIERRRSTQTPGPIRNILINNVLAETEGGVFIAGCADVLVQGVIVDQMNLQMRCSNNATHGYYDTRPSWPGTGLTQHPISSITCRQANDIRLSRIQLHWDQERPRYWLSAISATDVSGLILDTLRVSSAHKDEPVVDLQRIDGLCVSGCKALPGTTTYLRLSQVGSEQIDMHGNDLSSASTAVEYC